MSENRVKRAIDTDLSGLRTTARQREQIVQYALEGQNPMSYRSKFRVSIVLAIVLVMMTAVTALAVGLTSYFSGFAALENEYGEYEQWPGSTKVQLVELMLESGVLTAEDTPQWTDDLTGEAKEAAAEEILGVYFDGMIYVDTYNATTRVLGPIEQWTDEQRVMYTELLEKYGKLTDSWPVFQLPGGGDLTRDQAVARAKEALLSVFSLDAEYLNNLTPVDALFRADKYNEFSLPEDEPYWTVEIGYGITGHWVHMKRNGEILALSVPGSSYVYWGEDILDRATLAEPGEHDVTREEAIANARNSLTEIMNISFEDVDAMTATAQFFYHERFCRGDEPVWLVNWSRDGELQYRVLLGYDGSHIDMEPAGKQFDNTHRTDITLSDLWHEQCAEFGFAEGDYVGGQYYYWWPLEAKARFYQVMKPFVEEYATTHPYLPQDATYVQWTQNISGMPDEKAISQQTALSIAMEEMTKITGKEPNTPEIGIYYYTTNPDRPEWRFVHHSAGVAVAAYSGEVLSAIQFSNDFGIGDFLAEIIE